MIFLIIVMFFCIDIQASRQLLEEQSSSIFKDEFENIADLLSSHEQLRSVCSLLTTYKELKVENDERVDLVYTGLARCIKDMRQKAHDINNPKICIWQTHKDCIDQAKLKMENLLFCKIESNESCNLISMMSFVFDTINKNKSCDLPDDDNLQYDWCKGIEQEVLDWYKLEEERKKSLCKIDRLYYENQAFRSFQVQEELKNFKFKTIETYSDRYKNITNFFGGRSKTAPVITLAHLDETLERKFALKNK